MALVLCETDIINAGIYLKFTKSFTIKENIVGYCDVTKVYFSNKLFVYREEASGNFWSSSMMCMTLMCVKTVPGYYRLKNPAARLQLEFIAAEESWSGFFCTQRVLLKLFPRKLERVCILPSDLTGAWVGVISPLFAPSAGHSHLQFQLRNFSNRLKSVESHLYIIIMFITFWGST